MSHGVSIEDAVVGGIAARVRRPRPAGPAPPALSDDESDFEEEEYRRRQRSTAAGKRQKGKGAVAPPALAPVGSVRLSASELHVVLFRHRYITGACRSF